MKNSIDPTGEVISPDHENITPLFMRHLAAYKFFGGYVKDKKVLEIGFGEGYGSYQLSELASELTGVDISAELVRHASRKYKRDNLSFSLADGARLPFEDRSFDVVVSSQALEHVRDYMSFIKEAARVLKKGGTAIFGTPNKEMMLHGLNPYHYKEFSSGELYIALSNVFDDVEIWGLKGSGKYMAMKADEQGFAKKIVALDFLRLRRLMPRALIKPLYRMAFERVNKRTEKVSPAAAEITGDDFRMSPEKPEKSLDLFGLCRK